MRLYNNDPNFSIVLPGKCNANCDFCFWDETKCHKDYVQEMKEKISLIPQQYFRQISITGGEPTLSPYFEETVEEAFTNFEKVVITTNGTKLGDKIPFLFDMIKENHNNLFINISRHSHDDKRNEAIFKTSSVPSTSELESLIDECSKLGVPVRANCVLTNEYDTLESVREYIKWARSIGFDSIGFRKQHGNLDPSDQELMFSDYETLYKGNCPVCYSHIQKIMGVNVHWKSSIAEPSDAMEEVYELVLQPDGMLTMDWESKKEVVVVGAKLYSPTEIVSLAKRGLLGVYDHDEEYENMSSDGLHGNSCGSSSGGGRCR